MLRQESRHVLPCLAKAVRPFDFAEGRLWGGPIRLPERGFGINPVERDPHQRDHQKAQDAPFRTD
jgi:hypothetical protein